ncbi:MAG: pyruvate kinase [Armatimonadota bacterium]|nr:pyruvate kinase [Armatimonadota bacterium]MDR5674838.1 pyruvate kinase [Armatimonadota bacterium]MDR5688164.1 pyruvate kinase [Armatimonadota bacterium]MDR7388206.1 pyruvate kinase [Armatimonadota bacterium]MDR7390945.1 pyruvate kinase [Armatimonadota bacterium]
MASKCTLPRHRRTKIVATIGPATGEPDRLRALVEAGVDVMRFNFSHGTREEHRRWIQLVRRFSAELGRPVAILQDLQGPKIRVGELRDHRPVVLEEGSEVVIGAHTEGGTAQRLSVTYPELVREVRAGDRILLADGELELAVTSVGPQEVRARVVRGGLLEEHKGINLPGVTLRAPALTDKDVEDLRFGLEAGVDFVALSFVRRAEDVVQARELMERLGRTVPLVAKLEKAEAVDHLEEIMQASDGVMVARGDLGVELAPERVPTLQKHIIRRANELGIPVITATQMLESMVDHPRPTRAEASDVANAILDGTDAVMLSAETAAGRYPLEAVRMMDRIAVEVEAASPQLYQAPRQHDRRLGIAEAVAAAACRLSHDLRAKAIVVITRSGRTAQLVSKNRPAEPIVALTEDEAVARGLCLWWGVHPVVIEFREDTDAMLTHAEEELLRRGLVEPGDVLVVTGSAPIIARGRTNFVKVHRVRRAARP